VDITCNMLTAEKDRPTDTRRFETFRRQETDATGAQSEPAIALNVPTHCFNMIRECGK
jgi:hypothetical protein